MLQHTKRLSHSHWVYKTLFYLYLGLVLYATLSPVDDIKPDFDLPLNIAYIDKYVHIVMFAIMTILFHVSYPKMNIITSWVLLIILGLLIEFLQEVLPTERSFDWYDWMSDIIGVLLGSVIHRQFWGRYNSIDR